VSLRGRGGEGQERKTKGIEEGKAGRAGEKNEGEGPHGGF